MTYATTPHGSYHFKVVEVVEHEGHQWLILEPVEGLTGPRDQVNTPCGKPVGSKPWWMGLDQYDQCYCILPPLHKGECKCPCRP